MADIQFPDVVGTLAPLIQLDRQRDLMRRQDEAERRDQEAGAALPQALAGDKDAQAKVMANPRLGLQFSQYMERADASQRAQLKEASDWQGQAMMAVKNAKPEDKVATYKMALQDGYDRGYGKYLKNMPAEYSPAIEGLLDYHINRHQPYADYFKGRDSQLVAPPGSGGAPTAAPGGGGAAAPDQAAFIQQMMPHAMAVAQQTGLDPRLVIAQAALETGYGRAAPGNNFFGIKSHGRPGGQMLATTEAGPDGQMAQTQDSFRTYQNPGESAQDYVKFLQTNSRYAPVLAAKDLPSQIDALGRSGYATDPNYAAKIRQIAFSLPTPEAGPQIAPQYGRGPQPSGPSPVQLSGDPATGASAEELFRRATGSPQPQGVYRTPSGAAVDPSISPPAFMAQGGGDALPGQPGTMPQTIDQLNQHPMARELKSLLPPGYVIPVERGTGKIRLQDGVLTVLDPQGNAVQMQLPKLAEPPTGYRPTPNGLEPIPGGPADPARTMADKVPAGYRVKPDGSGHLEFIPGGPADPAIVKRASPMNNEQARDAGFADRMAQAENVLASVEGQGTQFWERLSEKAPAGTGTYAQSKEYQAFRQARDNFINAQLRRESGAAINKDEYVKADQQYFPQPGDKPEVIQQKALNRKLAVEGMIRGAGPTYQPSPSVPTGGEGPPAAPPPNGAQGPRLSPADAAKLPPGTSFIGMDGVPRVRH